MKTLKEFLMEMFEMYDWDKKSVYDCYDLCIEQVGEVKNSTYQRMVRRVYETHIKSKDILMENVGLRREQQRLRDKNNLNNQEIRKLIRSIDKTEQYTKDILDYISNTKFTVPIRSEIIHNDNRIGVVQLSDLHFNELVNITANKYNFSIASARLYYFAQYIKIIFKAMNISQVFVLCTGDLLNSDRRNDEKVAMEYPRAIGSVVGADLLKNFLIDLSTDFDITVANVCGNEGRIDYELGYIDHLFVNNFDYTVVEMTRMLTDGKNNIKFLITHPFEDVIKIGNQHWLLSHGIDFGNDIIKAISQARSKYAVDSQIIIDHIICGHIHSAYISDLFSRSASLGGGNSYSSRKLNLASRASQNIYIVEDKNVSGMKVDLQCVGMEKYPIKQDFLHKTGDN